MDPEDSEIKVPAMVPTYVGVWLRNAEDGSPLVARFQLWPESPEGYSDGPLVREGNLRLCLLVTVTEIPLGRGGVPAAVLEEGYCFDELLPIEVLPELASAIRQLRDSLPDNLHAIKQVAAILSQNAKLAVMASVSYRSLTFAIQLGPFKTSTSVDYDDLQIQNVFGMN